MLQRGTRAFHLALARLTPQLLGKLCDLGEAGGAQGVALGKQAAGGVDH